MKNTVRFLTLFLSLCLVFCLISCSSKEPSENQGEQPDPVKEEKLDFDEMVFRIAMDQGYDSHLFLYTLGTPLADAVQTHLNTVASETNCELKVFDRSVDSLLADVMSGSETTEIVYTSLSPNILNLALADGLVDFKEYRDIIDFEHNDFKYGPYNAREMGMVKGGQYALCPFSWPDIRAAACGLVVVNEDLVGQYNLGDPRELVEQKKWGWSDFETYIDNATFEDGVKYYGLGVGWYPDTTMLAFLSNGCRMFTFNPDGTYTSDVDSEAGLEAIQWAMDLRINHKSSFYKGTVARSNPGWDGFFAGEVILFSTNTVDYTNTIAYEIKNTGTVPFPVGPRGTYGDWAGFTFDAYQFSAFAEASDPELCIKAIDRICEPLGDYPDAEALRSYYIANTFFDARDADFYLKLTETATCNIFYGCCDFSSFWNVFSDNDGSAVELVASNFDKYRPIAEEYILPNAAYINEMKG